MAQTELDEIRTYWQKKYPNITITLFPHTEGQKYCGKMMSVSASVDLQADTIGELISQGESFLRQVNR